MSRSLVIFRIFPVATLAATLAIVLLISPARADTIITTSPAASEGENLTFTFWMQPPWWRTCYDYRTADGSATGSGAVPDYTATRGTLCWERFQGGQQAVTVATRRDSRCEQDESVKVILSNFRYQSRDGWKQFCGPGHTHPCQVTATGSIQRHANDCKAQFGR